MGRGLAYLVARVSSWSRCARITRSTLLPSNSMKLVFVCVCVCVHVCECAVRVHVCVHTAGLSINKHTYHLAISTVISRQTNSSRGTLGNQAHRHRGSNNSGWGSIYRACLTMAPWSPGGPLDPGAPLYPCRSVTM